MSDSTKKITSEHELGELVEEIVEEHDFNIEVGVEVAERFKRKAGQYRHGERKIRISEYLLKNHPGRVPRTVKHEIGHAVVMHRYGGGEVKPHGEEWKSVMRKLGVDNPEGRHDLQLAEYSYMVRCVNPECDVETGRHRKSRLVKQPSMYRCKECGSSFESFKLE